MMVIIDWLKPSWVTSKPRTQSTFSAEVLIFYLKKK